MANRPRLQISSLPGISEADMAATASPARGKEMRTNLLTKLRAPPLVHQWEFWHDRQDRKPKPDSLTTPSSASTPSSAGSVFSPTSSAAGEDNYEARLVKLHTIADVREFWELFNNFDVTRLPLRDSVHLFHKGVKPVWEDARNERGGAWTFRVPKDKAKDFWSAVAMMAIGETLQAAVASKRITFVDDICGISYSIRFNSNLITVWNRDAEHADGIKRILDTVLAELPQELQPKEGQYYYKKHAEHAGFKAAPSDGSGETRSAS